jgi:nickel-dependent lactate racemase
MRSSAFSGEKIHQPTPDMLLRLLSAAWYGDTELSLPLPDHWDVSIVDQEHYPAIGDSGIEESIRRPFGCPALSESAKGKKLVSILIDDIQRPTPVKKVFPFILDELNKGGIKRDQIMIIMATAAHRTATEEDFIKKLGIDIHAGIRTLSHDCNKDLVFLARTDRGTPIYVNKFFYESDLKVTIGGVYPNDGPGFGGGVKMVCPGMCGIETIQHLHANFNKVGRGISSANEFREEIEKVTEQTGLDFSVNVLLNRNREISHIFSGHRIIAHEQAVQAAKRIYNVKPVGNADIVLADIYPFDVSIHFISKGLWPLLSGREGSSKVVIAACPEGLGYHGLSLASLRGWSGFIRRMRALSRDNLYRSILRLKNKQPEFILFSRSIKMKELKKLYPAARVSNRWEHIINVLESIHKQPRVRVAVYRCASLEFPFRPE